MRLDLDLKAARQHLAALTGDPDGPATFQTVHDVSDGETKNPELAHVVHGKLSVHMRPNNTLAKKHARGAAIYVTNNQTDGKGRCLENIVAARGVHADLDHGLPDLPLPPSILTQTSPATETSPPHYQAVWLSDDLDRVTAKAINRSIVARLGADPGAIDIARVFRLAGSWHRKGEPFCVRLLEADSTRRYSAAQLVEAFGRVEESAPTPAGEAKPFTGNVSARAARELKHACQLLRNHRAVDGAKNGHSGINALVAERAFRLGRFGGSGELGEQEAKDAMWDACERAHREHPTESRARFDSTFDRQWRKGAEQPMGDWGPPPGEPLAGEETIFEDASAWQPPERERKPGEDDDRDEPKAGKADPVGLDNVLMSAQWPRFVEVQEARANGGYEPFPTGSPSIDAMLGGGLPRGQVTIMPAACATGKTSFAVDLALRTALSGRPALIVSLELPVEGLLCLVTSNQANGCPRHEVMQAKRVDAVRMLSTSMVDLPLAILERATPAEIEAVVVAMTERYGEPPLVCLDYAQQLADPAKVKDARIAAEVVSAALTEMAKRTGCALFELASVARPFKGKRPPRPQIGDAVHSAKESGRWESDAAVVIGLFAAGDDPGSGGRCKWVWALVDKNRWSGKLGLVALKYDGFRCSFEEGDPDAVPAPEKDPDQAAPGLDQRIREAVAKHEIKSMDKIALTVGGRKRTALARIKYLVGIGALVQDSKEEPFQWVEDVCRDM